MKNYFSSEINLLDFKKCCSQKVQLSDYPHADKVVEEVVIYQGDVLREILASENSMKDTASQVKNEIHHCFLQGSGVLVVKGFFKEAAVVDANTKIFYKIMEQEAAGGEIKGDHFAVPGTNRRVWNALGKVCEESPDDFIAYYSNPLFSLVSEAWLGPYFQMTAQVNLVKPDGKAQSPHRDYHMGFQSDEVVAKFPTTQQVASQYLTLQGGIAHGEVSVESGSTCLLPFSQQYPQGYLAWRDPRFIDYFLENKVQLPMAKGDAVFFSPALFHGAGDNLSNDKDRLVNLVQVSAVFGKPMEMVDREKMMKRAYPNLLSWWQAKKLSAIELKTVIGCIGDGYAFPTNLDTMPPVDGLAPSSLQDLMIASIKAGWSDEKFKNAVDEYEGKRKG